MQDNEHQVSESDFLRILYDFSASLIHITDLDELLWHVARQVVGQLGFEDCIIYLLDDDTDSLVQRAAIGDKNPDQDEIINQLTIPVGRGITGRVAASGQPILTADTRQESDYIVDTFEGASELCVPILFEGKVLGVIDSEDARPDYYTEQHLRFLQSVASLMGATIHRLRLTEEIHQAERERAALLEISAMRGKYADRHAYYRRLHEILSEVQPFDEMMVGVYDEATNRLDIPYAFQSGGEHWNTVELLGQEAPLSLPAYFLGQDRPMILRKENYRILAAERQVKIPQRFANFCIGVPFDIDDHGGLLVLWGYETDDIPKDSDLKLLSLLAAGVGEACKTDAVNQARMSAESELAASESRLRSIIENAPFMITLKSPDGTMLAAGDEFCRSYGITPDDLLGLKDVPGLDEKTSIIIRELEREVIDNRVVASREIASTGRNGESRNLVITKFPVIDDNGELTAVGGIGIEVTEQRQAEQQLLQAQRLEVVGQLTGGIAHDFNNLLMAVSGGVEQAIRLASDNEKLMPILELINRAANQGTDLTRRLSVFSRMQIFEHAPSDINVLVEEATELIKHALGSNIELVVNRDNELWPVLTDRNFFEHALLNLSINARDAMPDGGKLILNSTNTTVTERRKSIHGDIQPGDYVKVSVTDNGIGMSNTVLQKVFEPFFTTKEVGKGSGLGLSMVFGFVNQSGGCIDLKSEENVGTSVDVYLPRSAEKPEPCPTIADGQSPEPETKAKVLVVEDDGNIRSIMKHFLEGFGHDARIVEDGRSAMDVLEQDTEKFDLLITDIALPNGMDGRQVAAEFSRINGTSKVLYISGYAEDAVIQNGKLDDGHHFLAKPFMRDTLEEKISKILSH